MYKVFLSKEAAKFYKKADKRVRRRLDAAFDVIAENPLDVLHHDIRALHRPLEGLWRFRVGKFRIIYQVDRQDKRVNLVTIRGRGEAYRKKTR